MRSAGFVVVLLAACGRIGFGTATAVDGDASSDAVSDADNITDATDAMRPSLTYVGSLSNSGLNLSAIAIGPSATPGQTVVIMVATKPYTPITSVIGGGAAWSPFGEQCTEDNQANLAVFVGVIADTSNVIATLPSPALTLGISASRYDGGGSIAASSVVPFNHAGVSGGCGVGTVTGSYMQPVTALPNDIVLNAVVVKAQSRVLTFDANQIERVAVNAGVGADMVWLHLGEQRATITGSTAVSGTISGSNNEWSAIATAIR